MNKKMLLILFSILPFFIGCSITQLYPGPKLEANKISIIEDFPEGSFIDGKEVDGTVAVLPDKHKIFVYSGLTIKQTTKYQQNNSIYNNDIQLPFGCHLSLETIAGKRYKIETKLSQFNKKRPDSEIKWDPYISYDVKIIDVNTKEVIKEENNTKFLGKMQY